MCLPLRLVCTGLSAQCPEIAVVRAKGRSRELSPCRGKDQGEAGRSRLRPLKITEMWQVGHISSAMWCGCHGKAGRGAFTDSACPPTLSTVSEPTEEKQVFDSSPGNSNAQPE